MSDNIDNQQGAASHGGPLMPSGDSDMVKILEGQSFRETIRRIIDGFKAPKDSGEYRYAKFALLRMFGPGTISIVVGLAAVILLFTFAVGESLKQEAEIEVKMMDAETVKLDEIKIEEIKPEEIEVETEVNVDVSVPAPPSEYSAPSATPGVGVDGDLDTPMVAFAPVMTKSPLVMKNLYGNRTRGGRNKALASFGGNSATEAAVIKALRWLKEHQNPDGSWGPEKIADTGFALLTFLAHGETPASEEFGPTVEKGIKYLMEVQKPNGSLSGNAYSHGIAGYALCEAYAMTKIISVKDAAERALQIIVDGQGAKGGYDYGYAKTDRWDMSVSGWQFQAMKAGKMAGMVNSQLEDAIKKMLKFLREWSFGGTGWGYSGNNTTPTTGGGGSPQMTSVGALALQLHGHAKVKEVRKAVDWLAETQKFSWPKEGKAIPLYNYYYQTQVRFQEGGKFWNEWNLAFSPALVREQKADGHWEGGDHEGAAGLVYTTCMCALMLQVYYRYLPSFQKVEDTSGAAGSAVASDDPVVKVL